MSPFQVIIPSARAENLVACVRALTLCEPSLDPSSIIVIDDGARHQAMSRLPGVRWIAGVHPFVYARNVNLGIIAAGRDDVILLNDDACLSTPRGFTALSNQVNARQGVGICSAGIRGVVGNPAQIAGSTPQFRWEPRTLAFVCVYIQRATLDRLGPLDERFTGYGFEDNDYCERALRGGLQLAIWDGCVVDHAGDLPSTYRTRPDLYGLFEHNRESYLRKWGTLR